MNDNINSIMEKGELLDAVFESAPYAVNLWNDKNELILCNQMAVTLFGLESKEEYISNFSKLSPNKQPDGRLSSGAVAKLIDMTRNKGSSHFKWLHCNLSGDEIPCEIILTRLDITDENGGALIASYTHDLRPQLAGNIDGLSEEYFFGQISDKLLFNVVAELTAEWFWVYDVKDATIKFFGKGREILNLSDEKRPFPSSIIDAGMVFIDDVETFLKFDSDMKIGYNGPYDVRFNLPDATTRFYRIVFKSIYDKEGKARFAIGKTYDIHEQKMLESLSQKDLLTNCYNKVSAENLISEALQKNPDNSHALFIVDIDNFKGINDNLGHHFGDNVLIDISEKLNQSFRGGDIIGRIGGDEFIVFLKNTRELSTITEKAKNIANIFKNTYSGENNDYKISGSIGIALYPKDGKNFEELYKASDKALYQSKFSGKDMYTFYTKELADGTMKNRTILENATRMASSYFDASLISEIFDLMYGTQEIIPAINAVLKIVGTKLGVDRCYIFETTDEGKTYSNTFEWVKKGITPQMHNLQALSRESLGNFFDDLDKNDVLYGNDIESIEGKDAYELLKGQGIKAFMLVQTKIKEYTSLILGLDDCTKQRVWTEKEINSTTYALKMISIFIEASKKI